VFLVQAVDVFVFDASAFNFWRFKFLGLMAFHLILLRLMF